MNQNLKQLRSELLYLIIIFFVILIISGATRINPSLELLESEVAESTKIPAYISLIISCVFYIGTMAILFIIINFIAQYNKSEGEYPIFLEGASNFVITLCVFEVLKVGLTFMFFDKALHSVTNPELIAEQIKGTDWWIYDRWLSTVNAFVATLVFFYSCFKKNRNMKFLLLNSIIIFVGNLLLKLL